MARILLIDDNPSLRHAVQLMLERGGHAVTAADNGRVGADVASREEFDVVITDMLMPEADGLETIRYLRKLARPPKVLVISGGAQFAGVDLLQMASGLGADATLAKPFSRTALLEAVQRLLPEQAPTIPAGRP